MSTRKGTKRLLLPKSEKRKRSTGQTEQLTTASETVAVKKEPLDEEQQQAMSATDVSEIAAAATTTDVKPDIAELQQEISLKLEKQSLQQQLTVSASTTPMSASTSTMPISTIVPQSLPLQMPANVLQTGKPVIIIGDLATLQLAQMNNITFNVKTDTTIPIIDRGSTADITLAATTTTTKSSQQATKTSFTKFLDSIFPEDEFDLQESDIDEDGYSDIDFDEDDDIIEDDDEMDLFEPRWTDQLASSRMKFKFKPIYANMASSNTRIRSNYGKFYFDMLFGDVQMFFAQLAESVNQRALITIGNVWGQTYLKQASVEEMQIFFALCLQMSSLKLPTLADYWSENSFSGFSGFAMFMSFKRFQMLLKLLNFEHLKCDGSENVESKDGLSALAPLIAYFNKRMSTMNACIKQRIVINEPIIYWKGKLHWLKEMSEKFRCNAITLHFLTESTGFIMKIITDVERSQCVRNSKMLVSERKTLALRLLQEYLDKGYTVFASKFYSSYALAYELCYRRTYCTGFLDFKRYGNNKELIHKKLYPYAFETKYASAIMMGKWRRQHKSVYFYSSDCLAIYPQEIATRSIDKRPKIIKELEWQLNTSDNIKEYMLNYQITMERKQLRWDKQLAIYIFNLMLLNAYLLYEQNTPAVHLNDDRDKILTYAEYRQEIINEFLGPVIRANEKEQKSKDKQAKTAQQPDDVLAGDRNNSTAECHEKIAQDSEDNCVTDKLPKSAAAKLLEVEHLPMLVPRCKGKVIKKICRVCRKGGLYTPTKLCCEMCPGLPGLCERPCFTIWHDQLKKNIQAGESIKIRQFGTSKERAIVL